MTALIVVALGPLGVALTRAVLPYRTASTTQGMLDDIAAHRGAETIVVWCFPFVLATLVPGVLLVSAVARSRAPVLGTLGTALAVPGFAAGAWLYSVDLLAYSSSSNSAAAHVIDAASNSAVGNVLLTVFLIGHVFGTVLLGAALWRGRVLPAWLAVLLIISQPLHAFSVVVFPNGAIDGVAWTLTAVGFVAAVARSSASRLN